MWSNTLNDEWIKGIVEIGTFLVESIDNLGLIKTLLTVIGAGVIQKYFKGDLFGGLFGDKSSIESVKKGITDLENAYARAQERFNASKSTEDRKAMEDAKANLDAFKEANKPILDAEERKTALNEQLEKLKSEREQLRGDLQTAQDNLVDITTNGVQEDVRAFVEIDTSHIDNQIAGIQEKLDIAKQQLVDAESATWDDYKALGSMTPAKDKKNRVNDKRNEIKELEVELDNLQVKKDEFMSTKIDEVVTDGAKTQVADLTNKIDETDKAIQQTEVELKNVEVQANVTGNAGLTAGQKFKTGFNKAKASIKQFGKEMLTSMAWSMAIAAVFEMFSNLKDGLTPLFKDMDKSPEALQEKFDELNNELSSVESELKSLQSELEDTDERIEELMEQGSLTFVEQEELNKLKSVSAELKAQIGLQETLQKSKQQGVNSASIEATNAYLDTSFMSKQTRTEKQEEWGEYGEAIGQTVGTVGGAIFGAKVLGSIGTIGGPLGTAIGIAAGSIIGGLIGTFAGEGLAGATYDSEQTVGEAMDSMLETRAKLKEEQDKALAENDAEAYNEATEALRTYDAQMAKHISQIQQNYNAMDWELADPETRKEMMEYADWLDKYNISMGTAGAKSNAIARIFGDEASDELKEIKKRMEEAAEAGEEISLADAFNGDEEAYNAFKTRLYNIGLTVYETEQYFKDQKKAADEAIDSIETYDAIKQIQKLTGGVNDLKNAFKELHEEGLVSAETLLGLEDVFGDTDGWDEFFETMSSGTATMEEAEAKAKTLAENYVDGLLSSGKYSAKEYIAYISHLQSLGITNAKDFLDTKVKKNMVTDIANKVIEEPLTEAEKKEFDELNNVVGPLTLDQQERLNTLKSKSESMSLDDAIKAVEEEYGIKLDGENDRLLVEKAITAEKLKQEALDKQAAKNAYNTAVTNHNVAKEKNQAIDDEINSLSGKKTSDLQNSYGVGKTEYTGGTVPRPYVRYNGKTYYLNYDGSPTQELRDAIAANLASQKVEVPSLPAEVTEIDVTNANNASTEAANDLQAELDKHGLTLEINLIDKNELIDEAQNIYDTLANAAKEYGENGYVSVDTLQSLLQLEPKYLALLYDENGQLNLNKDTMYQLTVARVTDMGIQQAQQVIETARTALLDGNIKKLKELTEVTYGQATSNWDLVKSNLALLKTEMKDKGVDDSIYQGIEDQVFAIQNLTNTTIANIGNTISSSGNTATAEVEDAFKALMDYWDNRISANQAKYDQIQNDIDYLEAQGKMADANYYKDQLALLTEGEESKQAFLEAKLQGAAERLRELEAAGKEGSDEWWEAAQIYNDTLSELDDVRDTALELQDAIGNLKWDAFEEFNNRLDDLLGKLQKIRDLIAPNGEEDWFDDEGNWTEKGVAVLGSEVQELHSAQAGLDEANKNLKTFGITQNEDGTWSEKGYTGYEKWYEDEYGIHSEQEYYDWREKLLGEQYDAAVAVNEKEQDIAAMYESQVDAVEEYYQTLVDGYNDYIDSVKEALDAERDLFDFKKNVQKQSKDIATLERRIASLSGSTNASDIAERRKLEAELYDSRESLNDTYYDHSKQSQQEALEAESLAYEETMNRFVENLRTNLDTALENMDTFIQGVTSAVTVNAPTILEVYNSLGIALDSAIVDPWQSAIDAMGEDGYSGEEGLGLMNSWVAEGGVFSTFSAKATNYLTSVWDDDNVDPGNAFATAVSNKVSGIVTNIQKNVTTAKGYLQDLMNVKDSSVNYNTGGIVTTTEPIQTYDRGSVTNLQKVLRSVFNIAVPETGLFDDATVAALKKIQGSQYLNIGATGKYDSRTREAILRYIDARVKSINSSPYGGYMGGGLKVYSEAKKILPAAFHAKGTTGTTRDEWAITDEPQFGDELVLVPGKDGNLSFMRKGTGVVPADMTQKLFELAQIPTSDLMNKNLTAIVPNITKNDFKNEFNFESLVHVDTVDSDTLPKLEKMVDKKIDDFSRALNYSLKKFAR